MLLSLRLLRLQQQSLLSARFGLVGMRQVHQLQWLTTQLINHCCCCLQA
jgi:hypothetical protein